MLGKHSTIGNRAHYSHSVREVETEGPWRGQVTGECGVADESLGLALSSMTLTSHFPVWSSCSVRMCGEVQHLSLLLCPKYTFSDHDSRSTAQLLLHLTHLQEFRGKVITVITTDNLQHKSCCV